MILRIRKKLFDESPDEVFYHIICTALIFVTTITTGSRVKYFHVCIFSRKQRVSMQNLPRNMKVTHFFLLNLHTFPPKFLKFYIFFSISIKRDKNHFFEIYPVSKRSYNLRVFTHQWPRKFYIFFSISTKKKDHFY